VVLKELLKTGKSSKVVNHIRSVLVDNYDQCTDFRRAMKNKDQDDTDSNKSCQEWIRDLEADLEESKNQPKEPLEMI
jgi:hypothetical protein